MTATLAIETRLTPQQDRLFLDLGWRFSGYCLYGRFGCDVFRHSGFNQHFAGGNFRYCSLSRRILACRRSIDDRLFRHSFHRCGFDNGFRFRDRLCLHGNFSHGSSRRGFSFRRDRLHCVRDGPYWRFGDSL
jgi:hypothetical protein